VCGQALTRRIGHGPRGSVREHARVVFEHQRQGRGGSSE
jgi:hypothetical protein